MEEARGKKLASAAYERLAVYQRSYQAALVVNRELGVFIPGDAVKSDVALQLCRACRSIPANIAEGVNQTNSVGETKRFLGMSSRSCDEVRVWLSFCTDLELVAPETVAAWEQEYVEIGAMLYRLWQNWRAPQAS